MLRWRWVTLVFEVDQQTRMTVSALSQALEAQLCHVEDVIELVTASLNLSIRLTCLTLMHGAGHSVGRSNNYASHRHHHRPSTQPSVSQASTNHRLSDRHGGRERVHLNLPRRSPDRHRSRSERRASGQDRARSSSRANARPQTSPANVPTQCNTVQPASRVASIPAATNRRRSTGAHQAHPAIEKAPHATAAQAQQTNVSPLHAAQARSFAVQNIVAGVVQPVAQNRAAQAHGAVAVQNPIHHIAPHDHPGVPFQVSAFPVELDIPNYEALDGELDAFLPDEPPYDEPRPRPLPPLGMHAPPMIAAPMTVPLCWDWPTAQKPELHVPARPVETASAADLSSGLWANPGAATDHALIASHAAAVFMAPLMPRLAAQPLAAASQALHSPASLHSGFPHQDDKSDTAMPGHPASARRKDAIHSGPAPAMSQSICPTPTAVADKTATQGMEVAASVATPPALATDSDRPMAYTVTPPQAASGGEDTAGQKVVPAATPDTPRVAAVPSTLAVVTAAAHEHASEAAVTPVRSGEVPAALRKTDVAPPDSPRDRNPPHPAERSEDANMHACGSMHADAQRGPNAAGAGCAFRTCGRMHLLFAAQRPVVLWRRSYVTCRRGGWCT